MLQDTADKRHTSARRGAVLSSARTFRARDSRPAGIRGRRHSHARIHDRGASRKFDIAPRRRRGGASVQRGGWQERERRKDSPFYPLSRIRAPSRMHTTPAIYYRVTRELEGGRAVPRVLFRSVPDRVHIYDVAQLGGGCGDGGCFRNFRWIGTFVKASPPSGAGHRRRGERAWS